MAYIPEDKLLEIREAASIEEVVGQYVKLERRGKNLLGLCPFHADTKPSFTVSPDKGIFSCFGCGAGGNVLSFVMQHQRLSFPEAGTHLSAIRDDFGVLADTALGVLALPPVELEFVLAGTHLVPVRRGSIEGAHPYWEWILEPGRAVRDRQEEGWIRASVPFALMERNANCVHYGILALRIPETGGSGQVLWQVSSETCAYLKFDAWGRGEARFAVVPVAGAAGVRSAYEMELAARLPVRPGAELSAFGVDPSLFGHPDDVAAGDMTSFGVVLDGVHYAGGCATRAGTYPYCDVLPLPS